MSNTDSQSFAAEKLLTIKQTANPIDSSRKKVKRGQKKCAHIAAYDSFVFETINH